jgi:F0F1-type ATP synthase membrane subunit c/vacuolar-type H+-ATPase subunit K
LIYTSKASITKLPAPATPDPVALPGKVGYKFELSASLPPRKFNIVPSAQANLEASANYYSGQQKYYIKDAIAGGLGGGLVGMGAGLLGGNAASNGLTSYTPKKVFTQTSVNRLTPEQIKAIKAGAMDHLLDKEDQTPVESKQLEVIEAPTGRKFRDED